MGVRDILAVNLRLLRQRQKLTQEELAYRANMDRTYVSALERGVYSATIDVLDRLARALDVEVWELLKS
jgi:transcriptional regulator with XRE-family HTH domain